MHVPEHNPSGYDNATISDVEALGQNVRFMIMHGVADDNVHLQNTLVLLDKLDLANVDNYDMQVFPDSDHSIFFHNGHTLVYERKFPVFYIGALSMKSAVLTRHQVSRAGSSMRSMASGIVLRTRSRRGRC